MSYNTTYSVIVDFKLIIFHVNFWKKMNNPGFKIRSRKVKLYRSNYSFEEKTFEEKRNIYACSGFLFSKLLTC